MDRTILLDRLKKYNLLTREDEINATKEIVQEIILYGLSVAGFFNDALFQGGTALRILHNLPRFSEDMDFILKHSAQDFAWGHYIEIIKNTCEEFGIIPTITDKSKESTSIKKMFIKDNSFGAILNLDFAHEKLSNILIKLEIDVNPPLGSLTETKYLDFPLLYTVEAQDLPSNFACKIHALLCRKYVKGRDWYDFLWYVAKNTAPNLELLKNAIYQQGPWAQANIKFNASWYIDQLRSKIKELDWDKARQDVSRFLSTQDRQQLNLWGVNLFLDRLNKLNSGTA